MKLQLEKVFTQLIRIRETTVKAGIGLNIASLANSLDQVLDQFASLLNDVADDHGREVTAISGGDNRVHVLCRDGSLWEMNHHGEWTQHPPIPRKEIENAETRSAT